MRDAHEGLRKRYDFEVYRGPHGWLNDPMPGRYRQPDAAWARMITFLGDVHAGMFRADQVLWRFRSALVKDYDFSTHVRLE